MRSLRKKVIESDVVQWSRSFLAALEAAKHRHATAGGDRETAGATASEAS